MEFLFNMGKKIDVTFIALEARIYRARLQKKAQPVAIGWAFYFPIVNILNIMNLTCPLFISGIFICMPFIFS